MGEDETAKQIEEFVYNFYGGGGQACGAGRGMLPVPVTIAAGDIMMMTAVSVRIALGEFY